MTHKIPNDFFRTNKLQTYSAAMVFHFYTTVMFPHGGDPEIANTLSDIDTSKERMISIISEREKIDTLSGEDMVRLMRSEFDPLNKDHLCKRVLTMQDELIPLILKRYLTSLQDQFIETATCVLAYSEPKHLERLKEVYYDIQNPYTQSLACVAFAVAKREDLLPFLLEEYKRMKKKYPNETFEQGPLLAIYVLCGKL